MAEGEEIVVGFEYDRDAVWEKIKDRKSVFLDTNIWIDMADGKKPEAQPVKEKLREWVRSGRVFCPLFPALLCELYKQDSKLRTGTLMEELSLNVSFVRASEVYEWEVVRLAKQIADREDGRCSRKMLFVPFLGYAASWGSLIYKAGSDETFVRDTSKLIVDRMNTIGLTEYLGLHHEEWFLQFFKNMAPLPYQKQAQLFQEFAKGDRSKVWRIEEQAVLELYIKPVIDKLDADLRRPFHKFVTEAPRDKYGGCLPTLLARLPAHRNHVEVMTRNSVDPKRKDKVSDFFDLDMMPVPLAYADVFVTQDRWMRERFLVTGDFLKLNKCEFCSTYAELSDWLDRN